MASPSVFSVSVVLLAAGRSRRMGRPKLLLPWAKTSILGHLLEVWRELGAAEILVVVAADDKSISAELERLKFPRENRVLNPAPDAGMFSSIKCAASWVGGHGLSEAATHYAIALGDQPHVKREVLRTLLAFAAQHRYQICQPSYHGRGRHPVLLPRPIFEQLNGSRAPSLREFLAEREVSLLECDDPGLDLDVDTPADYKRARALAGETE